MTAPVRQAPNADIAFSPEHLGRLLPFYVLVDAGGVIRSVGPALGKLLGQDQVLGRRVFDVLSIRKPRQIDPQNGLRDALGKRLTVQIKGLKGPTPSAVFGMAFPIQRAGEEQVLLALTPGVNARSFVEEHGLKISDFGPADGSADLLPLLAMQADMLEDSKRKSERLTVARDAAERLANHDTLTGLPNRRALMQALSEALANRPVAVMHIDLDRFKEINDTYGHAAGDAALKHAASALREVSGTDAFCARLGGDEFVAILARAWPEKDLKDMAGNLIKRISKPFFFEGEALTAAASVGLAVAPKRDELTADTILHHADLALYDAKRTGRGRVALCTPALLTEQSAFQDLSADIRRGLVEQEFVAYLQPQVCAPSGAVMGFEALARWNHPSRGLLTPGDFLDTAGRAGLIQDIDAEVRRSALAALTHWDKSDTPIPKVSLNVSTRDLIDPRFREVLLWDLEAKGLTTKRVVLEIMEAVLYDENTAQITEACQALVQAGFVLALDDFGTGHASVLSLMKLPLSIVKIDRAFTAGVAQDPRKRAMAEALVGIATTLGHEALAEGVDDAADVAVFTAMGCTAFQSFHFGRAMAQEDASTWLVGRPIRPVAQGPGGAGSAQKDERPAEQPLLRQSSG